MSDPTTGEDAVPGGAAPARPVAALRPAGRRLALGERALLACLGVVLLLVWVEPPGSWLAEPDEMRYAEIPREMLATRDFVTPRLDTVPYFEKPPLLYWANAASIRLFGQTPWAVRFPTRLAAMGTTLLLLFWVGARWGRRAGLAAALLFPGVPLGYALARLNLTDGLLTFFFTATLVAGYEFVRRREAGRATAAVGLLMGLAGAGAFLSKGPVGVVLPGAILFLWCLATRRLRFLFPVLLGPAVPVFLALTVPWFVLMEARHPGFLRFFIVHEHLQRFATTSAQREGPVYFFPAVFLLGFLPGLPLLARSLMKRGRLAAWPREHEEALFFLLWLAVVLLFFSISRSKLVPYILPALPCAAVLAALELARERRGGRRGWLWGAIAVTALVLLVAALPSVRDTIGRARILPYALFAAASLLAGAWTSAVVASRGRARALALVCAGWAGAYASASLAWPHVLDLVRVHELAGAARDVADPQGAAVVFYRTFLRGAVWELERPIPVVEYRGELEPDADLVAGQTDIFWTAERFWSLWRSPRPVVVFVSERHLKEFDTLGSPARVVARDGHHLVLANFAPPPAPPRSQKVSPGLYASELEARPFPVSALPPPVAERVRNEAGGARAIWASREREEGLELYTVVLGGRRPRMLEVTPAGELFSLEEEVGQEDLPAAVRRTLREKFLSVTLLYAERETRRLLPPEVLYELCLLEGGRVREVRVEASGRLQSGLESP